MRRPAKARNSAIAPITRMAISSRLPRLSESPRCEKSAASPSPAAMPAIGPSQRERDAVPAAGAAAPGAAGAAVAPGRCGHHRIRGGTGERVAGRRASCGRRNNAPLHPEAATAAHARGVGEIRLHDGERCGGSKDNDKQSFHVIPPSALRLSAVADRASGLNIRGPRAGQPRRPRGCNNRRDRSPIVPSASSALPDPDARGSTRRDSGSSPRR